MKFDLFKTPYMRAWGEALPSGDLFTTVETGKAALVLPYRTSDQGGPSVLAMNQYRPEIGMSVFKTIGGYIRNGESPEDCVMRNLRDKLGYNGNKGVLELLGATVGYTTVVVPIQLFVLQNEWEKVTGHFIECTPVEMTLREAVESAITNRFGDDSSKEVIFRLALKMGFVL